MYLDFNKVKLSWTKYDIVRIVDIVESRDIFRKFYTKEISIDGSILRSVIGIESYEDSIPSFWNDLFDMELKVRKAFIFWWIVLTSHAIADRFKYFYTTGTFTGEYKHELGKVETNLRSLILKCGITNVQDRRSVIVPFDSSFLLATPGINRIFKLALSNYFRRHCKEYLDEDFFNACNKAEIYKVFGFEESVFNKWLTVEVRSTQIPYIESLHLKNFLCFKESIDINLDKSKEIYFFGENGTGKTSILKAFFMAFGAQPVLQNPSLMKPFSLLVSMLSKMSGSELNGTDSQGNLSKIDSSTHIPKVIAFGTNRDITKEQDQDSLGFMSLFSNEAALYQPIASIREHIDVNNSKDTNKFRELVQDITNDHLDVIIEPQHIKFFEDGELRDQSELSGGFRGLLILVSNIIAHLSSVSIDENIYQRTGVVLIDVIEQGLHPSIQKGVVFKIRKYFPNLQLIMTTCSQEIISAASQDSKIFTLTKDNGIYMVFSNCINL